ncbi:MAG: type II secretion system major pseudopilin GspG [Methylovirgula sp.]
MSDHQPQSVPSSDQHIFARASAGFTLIEMLVVLTIISLIIGLVGPKVLGYLAESRVKTAKLQIESFSSALDLFYMDVGRYPTDSEGLTVLVVRPPSAEIWNGPYVKGGRVPKDPWGHPYQYHTLSDHTPPYEITSLGPDGHGGKGAISTDVANAAR